MSHSTLRLTSGLVGIAFCLVCPVFAPAEEPDIPGEFKKAREVLLLKGSTAPFIVENGTKRIDAWKAAAEKGSAEAQWLLSRCYTLGVGVTEDPAEALRWMRKASDQGLSLAQNNLGTMLEHGIGVEADPMAARELYAKSAAQNDPAGQYNLALVYRDGTGVSADVKEAIKWFTKAAENKSSHAADALGELYEFGRGVKADPKEAAKWYARASEQGLTQSTANLVALNEDVRGLASDSAEQKPLRERLKEQAGKDVDKALARARARVVAGTTWRRAVKIKDQRYVLTLSLSADGTGQLYLLASSKPDDTEGSLKIRGLAYSVERKPKEITLVLERCDLLPDGKARVGISLEEGGSLLFKEGVVNWSKDDKVDLSLQGKWSLLDSDKPYGGLIVGPGGGLDLGKFRIGK
jgi:hypothetical protein